MAIKEKFIFILILSVTYLNFCSGTCVTDMDSKCSFRKRNIVIFFTKPDTKFDESYDDSGITFLKFSIQGSVKADAATSYSDVPKSFRDLFNVNYKSSNCEKAFNHNVMKLLDWATNERHMVTATVSTMDSSIACVIQKRFSPPINESSYEVTDAGNTQIKKSSESASNDPNYFVQNNDIFDQLPLETNMKSSEGLPELKYESGTFDAVPIINAYNPERVSRNLESRQEEIINSSNSKRLFNDDQKANSIEDLNNNLGYNFNVFEGNNDEKFGKQYVEKFKVDKSNGNKYNGLLTRIDFFAKLTDIFADSFLNTVEKRSLPQEENMVDRSAIGQVHSSPMVDLVKRTLCNLKIQSCKHRDKTSGYLMVVFGGKLSDVSDPFSDLVQSVKYVLENTKRNTVVVVTCMCPDQERARFYRFVPFYAKGERTNELSKSMSLSEFFDSLRSAISSLERRKKRLITTDNENSEYINNMFDPAVIENEMDEKYKSDKPKRTSSAGKHTASVLLVFVVLKIYWLF